MIKSILVNLWSAFARFIICGCKSDKFWCDFDMNIDHKIDLKFDFQFDVGTEVTAKLFFIFWIESKGWIIFQTSLKIKISIL